jgi:leucyl-tRNA synthetase
MEQFVQLISPIAPHIAEELWEKLGRKDSLTYASFPTYEESWTVDQEVEIVVQVNGKIADRVSIAADMDVAEMESLAKELEKVQELIAGKTIRKVIAVKGKLVNIVAN